MITAIIPTWNRADLVRRALATLAAQSIHVTPLVVDNASSDDTSTVAGQGLLRLPVNGGFSVAVNAGAAVAQTPYLLILNNDVLLAPDYCERLLAEIGEHAWATGKLFRTGEPDRLDATVDLISRGGTAWRAGTGRADGPIWDAPSAEGLPPFTALLCRRDRFLALGGLDERFESYLEDVDFGLSCLQRGWRGVYVPMARGWHDGSATLGVWSPRMVRLLARNQVWLIAKHYPPGWVWQVGWPVLVAQTLWTLLAIRHGTGWACVAGRIAGWRHYKRMRAAWPDESDRQFVISLVRRSEQEIRRLQAAAGGDRYWRVYSWFT